MSPGQPFFDALLHVFDTRFPLVPELSFTPPAYSADDYRHQARQLLSAAGFHPAGGAVLAPSWHGTCPDVLPQALQALGAGYYGVAQLAADVTDEAILRLHAAGVRATRLNLVRRVHVDDVEGQLALARRTRELVGWHLELYVDSRDLAELAGRLPAADSLVVDHLGLSAAGLRHLLALVEAGARVKATGFARCDLDVPRTLRAIHRASPQALMAGTDLPGTRSPHAVTAADLMVLRRVFDGDDLDRVVHRNAVDRYRDAAC